MVEEIIKTEADIIGCNWCLSFNHNERKMNQPSFVSSGEAIQKCCMVLCAGTYGFLL